MPSLKSASSFINPLIRSLRHPSPKITAPTSYLATRTIPKPPQNLIFYPRRFSTNPEPEAIWEITVPKEVAYVVERNGKYLKTLYQGDHLLIPHADKIVEEYYEPDPFPIRISTSGSASADESWAKGEKLAMEFEAFIMAPIVDPDVTFTLDEWYQDDFRQDVQVTEILERTIQKIISEENIPRLIEENTRLCKKYKGVYSRWDKLDSGIFKSILRREMEEGAIDDLNAVIKPRYGYECLYFQNCCWYMSPALIKRLFGEGVEEVWTKTVDLTIAEVKSSSENILRRLEDMKMAEHIKDFQPTQSPIFCRSSINPDPKADREIIVPSDRDIQKLTRNDKYQKILDDDGYPYFRLLASTSGFASQGKLGMKLEAEFTAEIVDPDLASYTCGDRITNSEKRPIPIIDLRNHVQVQEVLERNIQKMISDDNIPELIRKKVRRPQKYKSIFKEELKKLGVLNEINKIITLRYGLKCTWFGYVCGDKSSCLLSPALIDRLFGVEATVVWCEQFDLTFKKLKLESDAILRMLEDMRTEHKDVDKIRTSMYRSLQGAKEIESGLDFLRLLRNAIFEDVGDYLEENTKPIAPLKNPLDWTLERTERDGINSALEHLLERGEFIFKKDLPQRLEDGYLVDSPPPAPTYTGCALE